MNTLLRNKKRLLASLFALLLAMVSLLDVQAQITELTEIIIGDGNEESCEIPFNVCTNGYAYAECIFPAEAIGDPCIIYSISFYCAKTWLDNSNYIYPQNYYLLSFYVGTTSQTSYITSTNWTTPDNYTKVFERREWGRFCEQIGWDSFVLDTPFYYEGGNLVIGILINSSGWASFATPMTIAGTSTEGASLLADNIISLPSANTEGTIVDFCPNIKLGIIRETLTSNPTSIEIGYRPNNCWTEPYNAFLVNEGIPGAVSAVDIDNSYFSLSDFEIPHVYSQLEAVPYAVSTGIGEGTQTGNITFTYGNNKTLEVPINATAYTPTTPDVWEMAREINTFPYSETIMNDMMVYDNYQLPGNHSDGKDVVFKLNLNSDVMLTASVTDGDNGKVSLYQEGFEGQGGPMVDNFHYYGYEHGPGLCGTNFEKGSFDVYKWNSNSTYPWVISPYNSYGGAYCIKSNNQGVRNSLSSIAFTHYIPYNVTVCFWAKVSSESGYDKGFFFIDGTAQINGISGDGEWTYYSYEVPQGLHTFKWEYKKDGNTDSYEDCFYVDNVFFGDVYDEALNSIDERQVFTGTYYLVASSTSDDFTVSVNAEMMPLPVAASLPMPVDYFNCYDDNTVSLNWKLGDYTKEYQILFGETNPPTDVLVDWTTELAENRDEVLTESAKTYYWQVNERNTSGITEGPIWTFSTFREINASADNIIYVSPTGAGVKDGSSWANAATSIQAAIDAAAGITENQPVVWVAKGNYFANGIYQTINDKTCCFRGYGGVKLFGGFDGDEPANYDLSQRDLENNATILDAESHCYVVGTQSSEWDGFVMQYGGEGGFYSCGETSTVKNCKILYSEGNGVNVGSGALNCIHNEVSHHANNGIIQEWYYCHLNISDCIISYNGGNGVLGNLCVRCQICNNGNGFCMRSSMGGAVIGCLIANNDGFGAKCDYIVNSTIVNNGVGINECSYRMGIVLCNSIVWGNNVQQNWQWSSPYLFTNNAIQGGLGDKCGIHPCIVLASRDDETGTSPEFEHPSSGVGSAYSDGIWILKATSPCINMGMENMEPIPGMGNLFSSYTGFTSAIDYLDVDFEGNPRIQQGRIDLGALESPYEKPYYQFTIRPDANNIIYVKEDGQGDGSSWDNATSNLQEAVETSILYEPVATVWVAQGTYSVTDFSFQVKEKLIMYGGFEGNEAADFNLNQRDFVNHASVLDGNNALRVLYQRDVLNETTAAIIDGFTLLNGVADNGAGAYLLKYTTLSHCNVRNNTASGDNAGKGGGVYTDQATVIDCFVENNTANQGGGIYAINSKIIQSHIGNNMANDVAGGIYSQTSDVMQCNIVKNEGDGVLVCADDNNSQANVYNSILWGNTGNNLAYHSGMAQNNTNVSHCAIEHLQDINNGNIPLSTDNEGDFGPHFVNPIQEVGLTNSTGDWQLGENSVCIDAGNPSLPNIAMPLYDIINTPRIQFDYVDIGAFESSYAAPCQEMEVLEVSISEGDTYDFYGTLLSQPGTYEHSWVEDGCLHLVMLQLRTTRTYYVSETGSGNMDGSSWENALDGNTVLESGYVKLAEALQNAVSGDQFWVAEGTYLPCGDNDVTKHFVLNEGVCVYGGFVGTESSLDERDLENVLTIFSGELQGDEDESNNADGIFVTAQANTLWSQNAILDGVTLTAGYATSHQGAALRVNENTKAALNQCRVQQNYEGGIYNMGRLEIDNSDLSNNNTQQMSGTCMSFPTLGYTFYYGAGALCNMDQGTVVLNNCTFLSNNSNNNGAIFNSGKMTIDSSLFENNYADCYGTIMSPGKLKIHNTTFNDNRSEHYIAVMMVRDSLEMVNCDITNNKSNYYTSTHYPSGGAANFASKRTSGIESWGYSRVVNCTFLKNDAGTCPGGALTIKGTADVENCIFNENEGQRYWRDPESGGNIGAGVFIGNPDGGALYVEGTARVSDCVFSENSGYRGHSIGVFGGSLTMERCKVVNSIAVSSLGRGAIAVQGNGNVLTINNSLIVNNNNVILFQIGNAHTCFNNTTIVNNSGEAAFWFNSVSSSSIIEMNNCIFSGYPSNLQVYELGSEGTLVMNNTLMNQPVSGGDNDPLFVNPTTFMGYDENVDPLTYDWTLQPGSPCINAGDASLIDLDPLAVDLAGEPRVKDGQIDMGAYEYGPDYVLITATTYPSNGGTIAGAGIYNLGATATLTATADESYVFANWTKDGAVVSTSPSYSFEVTEPATFVANFISFHFDVSVSMNLDEAGTVQGAGAYYYGETCTLTATPNEGYLFVNWTEDGEEVSTESTLSFVVTGDRSLVANFGIPTVTQTTTLNAGNSWWSTNLEITLEELEAAMGSHVNSITSQEGGIAYMEGYGWDGDFNALDLAKMYKIEVNETFDLVLEGAEADPADHPITIRKGANWIGYPVPQSMSIGIALADFTPASGDMIKSKKTYATRIGGNWIGTLKTLEPGQGYIYTSKYDGEKTLVYSNGTRGNAAVEKNITPENNLWIPSPERFMDNMNVTAVVDLEGVELVGEDVEVGAFVGTECRGSVKLMYVEETGRYVAFLTVHGHDGEMVSFKVFNEGNTIEAEETVEMRSDAIIGELESPFVLHDSHNVPISLFPNPVERGGNVRLELPAGIDLTGARVEIYDALGVLVMTETLTQGKTEFAAMDVCGIYTVKVRDRKGNVCYGKLVVR